MDSKLAIGLMSGTSRDGIDAALIRSDGENITQSMAFHSIEYAPGFREKLAAACDQAMAKDQPISNSMINAVEVELDEAHIAITQALLAKANISSSDVHVVGYHGHTIGHKPHKRWTWQIGDGERLASALDIDVVSDLRGADVAAGGQGAPMLPIFHRVLANGLAKPALILNLGGVANITYIGSDGELIAFDTGMASALIDSWMLKSAGTSYDFDGTAAAAGKIDNAILSNMMEHRYFGQTAPKSLDRTEFTIEPVHGLSVEDGAATLTAFTAKSIAVAIDMLPQRPAAVYVAGGGRHNTTLMQMIEQYCDVTTHSVDQLGWNGDGLEAEGFAYMALRSLKALPISFPGTTGVPTPLTGGKLHQA